jgi:hypothetical protein
MTFEAFVELLNRGNAEDSGKLARLPGFVAASNAATLESYKRDVLAKMEKAGIDWWPVVSDHLKLQGSYGKGAPGRQSDSRCEGSTHGECADAQ